MKTISLRLATKKDDSLVIAYDYALMKNEPNEPNRQNKITKAISDKECFIILADTIAVGFVLFDYRFFDQGWIELMIIEGKHRGKGISQYVFDLICEKRNTNKVFTSTNNSNVPMQKALTNAGFIFSGKLEGLDEGDPEIFYYRKENSK